MKFYIIDLDEVIERKLKILPCKDPVFVVVNQNKVGVSFTREIEHCEYVGIYLKSDITHINKTETVDDLFVSDPNVFDSVTRRYSKSTFNLERVTFVGNRPKYNFSSFFDVVVLGNPEISSEEYDMIKNKRLYTMNIDEMTKYFFGIFVRNYFLENECDKNIGC